MDNLNKTERNNKCIPINVILFIIWFTLSFFGLIVLRVMNDEPGLIIFFAQFFPVFILFCLTANKKWCLIFPLLGIILILGVFFRDLLFSGGIHIDTGIVLTTSLGIAFFLGGLFLLIMFKKNNIEDDANYIQVTGTVTRYDIKEGKTGCFYKFQFNGREYEVLFPYHTNAGFHKIGSIHNIKVNEKNPYNIIVNVNTFFHHFLCFSFIIVGIIVTIAGLFLFK